MKGRLYGVGLGPGDPDLITRKAARLISAADVIAYPSLAGANSFARAIAADLIPDDAEELVIDVPMTEAREPAQAAYDLGAARIANHLEVGRNVVLLCEGDPLFYGSFMYLHARLKADHAVEIVPGVTSLTACAAEAALPLSARKESLTILPGPLPDAELEARITTSDSLVIMKVGRHLGRLRKLLARLALADRAVYVEHATLPSQQVLALSDAPDPAPYFSMILITKGADPWL